MDTFRNDNYYESNNFDRRRYQYDNNRSPSIVPLETRLLKPGVYDGSGHHMQNNGPPIRRVKQRVRNYCAML